MNTIRAEEATGVEVRAAARELALCMVAFRDLLTDDGYVTFLPHFAALAEALSAADADDVPVELPHPRDPAAIALSIASA